MSGWPWPPRPSPTPGRCWSRCGRRPELVRVVDPTGPPAWDEVVTDPRPLVLDGDRLVTQRQYADERLVAEELLRRAGPGAGPVPAGALRLLDRVLPAAADPSQRAAALTALGHRVSVVAGGPGTGKTFTVAASWSRPSGRGEADTAGPAVDRGRRPHGKAAARAGEALAGVARRRSATGSRASCPPRSTACSAADPARRPASPTTATIACPTTWSSWTRPRWSRSASWRGSSRRSTTTPASCWWATRASSRASSRGACWPTWSPRPRSPASPLHDVVATLTTSHRVEAGTAIPELAEAIRAGDADAVLALLAAWPPRCGGSYAADPVAVADAVLEPVLGHLRPGRWPWPGRATGRPRRSALGPRGRGPGAVRTPAGSLRGAAVERPVEQRLVGPARPTGTRVGWCWWAATTPARGWPTATPGWPSCPWAPPAASPMPGSAAILGPTPEPRARTTS